MTTETWTVRRVLDWATADFRARGFDSPRLEAELLLTKATRLDRVRLIVEGERPLLAAELEEVRGLIQRRRRAEPIAYILGKREFYGLDFVVDSRVLIPRPDTEFLVEVALSATQARHEFGVALDLCTGSGCVAIAFAKQRPTWRVTASDISKDALAVAQLNAERLGAAFGMRFVASDLFSDLDREQRYSLITANPPYIPQSEIAVLQADIREFEPELALRGGADGLDVTRRLIREAPNYLGPGGVLALEVGYDQAPRVATLLTDAGLSEVRCTKDYGGHERVVSGRKLG